jgi:hypothetical protein
MREYTSMLEQAQGTIQSLQQVEKIKEEDVMNSLDIRNYSASVSTDEEEEDDINSRSSTSSSDSSRSSINAELYRHRIIKKRASNPDVAAKVAPTIVSPVYQKKQAWLPQKGLRILLNDSYQGF